MDSSINALHSVLLPLSFVAGMLLVRALAYGETWIRPAGFACWFIGGIALLFNAKYDNVIGNEKLVIASLFTLPAVFCGLGLIFALSENPDKSKIAKEEWLVILGSLVLAFAAVLVKNPIISNLALIAAFFIPLLMVLPALDRRKTLGKDWVWGSLGLGIFAIAVASFSYGHLNAASILMLSIFVFVVWHKVREVPEAVHFDNLKTHAIERRAFLEMQVLGDVNRSSNKPEEQQRFHDCSLLINQDIGAITDFDVLEQFALKVDKQLLVYNAHLPVAVSKGARELKLTKENEIKSKTRSGKSYEQDAALREKRMAEATRLGKAPRPKGALR